MRLSAMDSFLAVDEMNQLIERHNDMTEDDPTRPPHGGGRTGSR